MLELKIPELGLNDRSTKDLVITLLLREYPLNVRQVWKRLRKRFGKDISYQAAYKVVSKLSENGVLTRNSEGTYEISFDWIAKLKDFSSAAESLYMERDKSQLIERNKNSKIRQTDLSIFH